MFFLKRGRGVVYLHELGNNLGMWHNMPPLSPWHTNAKSVCMLTILLEALSCNCGHPMSSFLEKILVSKNMPIGKPSSYGGLHVPLARRFPLKGMQMFYSLIQLLPLPHTLIGPS